MEQPNCDRTRMGIRVAVIINFFHAQSNAYNPLTSSVSCCCCTRLTMEIGWHWGAHFCCTRATNFWCLICKTFSDDGFLFLTFQSASKHEYLFCDAESKMLIGNEFPANDFDVFKNMICCLWGIQKKEFLGIFVNTRFNTI